METFKLTLVLLGLIFTAMCAVAVEASAQSPPADVPPIAQHEIARRGNHVELTGTIRSGLMAMALSPPADDSSKWFVTLIVKPGAADSEAMRSTFASDPALRPWVDVREPLKSTTHYHVRSIDDATQADWLSGLRPAIARSGLPLVVLQPPKNGQFGPSATIVKLIGGVVPGDKLAAKLRTAIIDYVQAIESPVGWALPTALPTASPTAGEHAKQFVSSAHPTGIGVPPPFNVPPKDPPPPPNTPPAVPFDWPPVVPVAPAVPPPNPTLPASDLPERVLAWLTWALLFAAGWIGARLKTFSGEKIAAFARLIELMKQPPAPPPNPVP